jgi:hypothetical protein
MAAAAKQPRNTALRQPPNKRLEGAVEKPAQTESAPQTRARRRDAAIVPEDEPMFPVGSLVDNLLYNKTLRSKRLIFKQSVIGPRGTRQYQYEIEDQGQCIWSYRPLGAWQE